MHSKTFFTVFALATAVVSAPLPGSGDVWASSPPTKSISDLLGSPFGNGNGDASSNEVGSGNDKNGNGNGIGDGNSNGDGNIFGNGNNIGSGDSGISIGRRGGDDWLGETIDGLVGSPFGNGNGDGSGNSVGSGNVGNGNGNGQNDGNGNGDGNEFGNGNNIGSGDSGLKIGRKVRDLPPDAAALIPEQTIDELDEDFSGLITIVPGSIQKVAQGAVSGVDNQKRETKEQLNKKQVLTGLEDIIAQGIAADLP